MRLIFVLSLFLCMCYLNAQETPIEIVTEEIPNRLAFYAINENDQEFDVILTISGTNFRQSRAVPRAIRLPATSKVLLQTIVPMRGKIPSYKTELIVKDSLSGNALKKAHTKIKIRPKRQIILYVAPNCLTCDSLLSKMSEGKYLFESHDLRLKPEIKDQLQKIFGTRSPLDSVSTPILNIGGKLFTKIETYEGMLEELNKD